MANQNKPLQIFKPGRHTAMSGAELAFSEADLAASAAAYDPALHEAPIVVGHPTLDGPAYGWVKALAFADGGLEAEPDQVDPAFAELVTAGRFKKISAAFFPPDSPKNPKPGVYYLRHVGFLGAQPPAVKGLRAPAFAADDEAVTFEFSEYDDVVNADLWRSLRDWFIGKFGQEEADKVVPGYQVASLEQGAQDELREAQDETGAIASPGFSESTTKETSTVTPEKAAQLEAENAQLKKELADNRRAAIHADHTAFAEKLVDAGKMLPAQSAVAVATLDHLATLETPVEFGEGDDKAPLIGAFKTFLEGMPKLVEFAERATTQRAAGAAQSDRDIAARAARYKAQRDASGQTISIAQAIDAVSNGADLS